MAGSIITMEDIYRRLDVAYEDYQKADKAYSAALGRDIVRLATPSINSARAILFKKRLEAYHIYLSWAKVKEAVHNGIDPVVAVLARSDLV